MRPGAKYAALWHRLYARTFVSLQRQYPLLAPAGLAHLARDAADDAIAELRVSSFTDLPPPALAPSVAPRMRARDIEDLRTSLGLPPKRTSEDE